MIIFHLAADDVHKPWRFKKRIKGGWADKPHRLKRLNIFFWGKETRSVQVQVLLFGKGGVLHESIFLQINISFEMRN